MEQTFTRLAFEIHDKQELIDAMRMALELIAVGDVEEPTDFAESVLVGLGFWTEEK